MSLLTSYLGITPGMSEVEVLRKELATMRRLKAQAYEPYLLACGLVTCLEDDLHKAIEREKSPSTEAQLLARLLAGHEWPTKELLTHHFSDARHCLVYEACQRIRGVGEVLDIVKVAEQLKGCGELACIGGIGWLTELLDTPAKPGAIDNLAALIVSNWEAR